MATKQRTEQKEKKRADMKAAAARAAQKGRRAPIKLPEGMSQFYWKEDKTYRLDYLEYEAGEHNPDADKGFLVAWRKYRVHTNVGPNNEMVACLGNWGERCPVCEFVETIPAKERWTTQKELTKTVAPKERQILAVRNRDDKSKGVQIQESSVFGGIGAKIDDKINVKEKYKVFAQNKGGYTLEVAVMKNSWKGYDIKDIEWKQREDIPDEIMSKVPCLDDLIIKPDYKKFKKLFEQGSGSMDNDDDSTVDSAEEGSDPSSVEETAKAVDKKKSKKRPEKDSEVATSSPLEPSDEDSSVEASSEEEGSAEEPSSAADSDEEGSAEEPSSAEDNSEEEDSAEEPSSAEDKSSPLEEPSKTEKKTTKKRTTKKS